MRIPCRCWLPSIVLLSVLAGCRRNEAPQDVNATAKVRKARIFLIAIEDHGSAGPAVGCGDSAVPVEADLPAPSPALWGSLETLLSAGKRYESAGFYNALANSPLRVERIDRSGSTVRIYLNGYLEIGGECDSPRVLSQLTETATQFPDVEKAEIFLDGKPLERLLSGKG
ncbi:MAG TPA: GerMN domain-containing protein [Thermoanaerobaculia bacterium]|nr:GerMN domain-containing protein [Thermoanaerobaculia bacterium]